MKIHSFYIYYEKNRSQMLNIWIGFKLHGYKHTHSTLKWFKVSTSSLYQAYSKICLINLLESLLLLQWKPVKKKNYSNQNYIWSPASLLLVSTMRNSSWVYLIISLYHHPKSGRLPRQAVTYLNIQIKEKELVKL